MAEAFRIDFDTSALDAALDNLSERVKEQVRPAAQAGAQVLYDEVRFRVPVSSGKLRAAIYQAFSQDNSKDGTATYHISWNARRAPHGHLIEFGTVKMAARPFLRPAYDAASAKALEAAKARLVEGMK
jgi:HK97 gp10 family phage protein